MSTKRTKRSRTTYDEVLDNLARRQDALRNGGKGLVPVRCRHCRRAIATTAVDRAKGEPPVLLDFPENISDRWVCTECATRERGNA